MPYIVKKRSDIADGLLQTLDLTPNTSRRRFPYSPAGQTGYRRTILNETPSLSSYAFQEDASGLTAWFLANVSDGSGTAATGSMTTVDPTLLSDGEYFTIGDGTTSKRFVFVKTSGYAVPSPYVEVDISSAASADDVRDAVVSAVNAVDNFNVSATASALATVTFTNTDHNLTTAAERNAATITENVAEATFAVTSWSGATDSASLTVAEATQNATDVLNLIGYDSTTAASDIDYSSINSALTTGSIVQSQLSAILDILSGRTYTVSSGTTIESGGAFVYSHSSSFWADDTRHVYMSGALRISLAEGRLAEWVSDSYEFGGTTGAALVVFDDDGTIISLPS